MHENLTARRVRAVAEKLIDQRAARTIVAPYEDGDGFWFGGGSLTAGPGVFGGPDSNGGRGGAGGPGGHGGSGGKLYLTGRYRNRGDSRTGLAMGARGLELAVFESGDGGATFEKILSFAKKDLVPESSPGSEPAGFEDTDVLSIEGSALQFTGEGVELYVSSEKSGIPYPGEVESFQKPGTGVWGIDIITADTVEGLGKAPVVPLIYSDEPEHLHIKDPVVHRSSRGETVLIFCHHPFSWSSSNSAYCIRSRGERRFSEPDYEFFPRGSTWDVAVSRITDVLTMPAELIGVDSGESTVQAVFYDGAECMRPHDQNPKGVDRPRGFSCEEIAGLALYSDDAVGQIRRVSTTLPLFTSPWGTGSCRYIHTCATEDGVFAAWQQSRESGAQPLVLNFLDWKTIGKVAREVE